MRSNKNEAPLSRDLGQAIRAQRVALGLTQKEASLLAGCGPIFINQLERGKSTVRLDKLLDVLAMLGLQLTLGIGKPALKVDDGRS